MALHGKLRIDSSVAENKFESPGYSMDFRIAKHTFSLTERFNRTRNPSFWKFGKGPPFGKYTPPLVTLFWALEQVDFENSNWLMQLVSRFLLLRSLNAQFTHILRASDRVARNMPAVFRSILEKELQARMVVPRLRAPKRLEVMYEVVGTRSGGGHDAI